MCLRLSSSDYVKDESRDLFIGKRKEDDAVIVYLKEKAYNDQGYHTHYSNYQKEVNANRMKLVCSMMSLPLSFSSFSLSLPYNFMFNMKKIYIFTRTIQTAVAYRLIKNM